MSFLWLIVWLLSGTPDVFFWNSWAIALAICMFIDVTNISVTVRED